MQKRTSFLRRLAGLLLAAALVAGACRVFSPATPEPAAIPAEVTVEAQPDSAPVESPAVGEAPAPQIETSPPPRFAVYQQSQVGISPVVNHEPIAADLSNVYNPFVLSQAQREMLGKNGFVVSPGTNKEFYMLYEKARYDNAPIFVTSDSLLHVYHLLFDKTLRTAETEHFIPLLQSLNQAMLAETDSQYQALKGTNWEDAARRTVAFIGVGSKLLDANAVVPAYAADLVEGELANIEAASGILPSPIFSGLDNGEDYTQYIPRGHYTKSEALKAYFKSMMWYGRMTFRLKSMNPEAGKAETRSALLLVQALRKAQVNGGPAEQAWQDLYAPTVFFVGRSDDLTAMQYEGVIDAVYGPDPDLATLSDEGRLEQFITLADQLPPPMILGIVISVEDDETKATKGLRFMGQRFVPDAYIFRQLIYRNVGTADHRRGLPKGLDVFAAMGSERAYQILDQMGETGYANYPEQMDKMRKWTAGLSVEDWTETLYNTWMYSFFPLLEPPGAGYPAFMQSPAWTDKQLNTALGSWAELKHDTILYAKQAYAEMGGGPPPPPPTPPQGYVEPVPEFYARLQALTNMTHSGLQERGLLNDFDRQSLEKLSALAGALQLMAQKELSGEPLSDEEYERIRYYGGELEHLTMAAADMDTREEVGEPFVEEEPQAAVIADVATDPDPDGDGIPNPTVLEEGVGRINEIHAVAPIVNSDGSVTLQVVKGGVFAYYEFQWPADDRLTDEKWRQMLDEGQAPPLPEWTSSFVTSEGEFSDLGSAVLNFQKEVIYAYWQPEYAALNRPGMQGYTGEVQGLLAAKQYMAHLLMRSQIRSVDLQSPTLAVITVRETWQDTLHQYQGDYANYDEPASASRGPYELDVTYALERVDNYWQVTQVVYANQAPGWE